MAFYKIVQHKLLTFPSHLSLANSSFKTLVVSTFGLAFLLDSTTSAQRWNSLCFWWWRRWYSCDRRQQREHTEKFWEI